MKRKKLDVEKYKAILLEKHRTLVQNIHSMENSVLRNSLREDNGNLTNLPTHIADISADTFSQNLTIELLENEEGVIKDISDALERIEEGTYGICQTCGISIPEKRLEYIPYARMCVKCKTEEERRSPRRWR